MIVEDISMTSKHSHYYDYSSAYLLSENGFQRLHLSVSDTLDQGHNDSHIIDRVHTYKPTLSIKCSGHQGRTTACRSRHSQYLLEPKLFS